MKSKDTSWESFRYIIKRGVIVPVALGVGVATVGVAVFKWWRKKCVA